MFYRPGEDRPGLPHNPFKAMVAPRPIGWISSLSADGAANLAPYSFFNAVADEPMMVVFGSSGLKPDGAGKDSVANIRATGEFAVNLVSCDLRDAMNASAAHLPAGADEFEAAGLAKAPCVVIRPPRVAIAPGALECRLFRIIDLPGPDSHLVIGEVVGLHLDEAFIRDGRFDVTLWQPLARLGYRDFAVVREVFALKRPGET